MAENLEKKEVETKKIEENNIESNTNKNRKMKGRTIFVIAVLAVFIIGTMIVNRAEYLETLEIGEEYLEVYMQNIRYKQYIAVVNFIIIFITVYITTKFIKKGLKKFFEEEKLEMPKLPNKSLALVIGLVTSIVVSNLFLQKTILFVNSAQFGLPDPIFNMDAGFYMFQAPLIGQLLYYAITILIILAIYTVAYYIITFNKYFDGINGKTLRDNTFIKQLLSYVMLISVFVSAIIFFNMQNMVINGFLTLDDKMKTTIIGAGAVDRNKIVGI